MLHPSRSVLGSGLRSAVAWVAIAACVLRWWVCPIPDAEVSSSAAVAGYQHGLPVHVESPAAEHRDSDLCCQLLSDSTAMAVPLALVSAAKFIAPLLLIAIVTMGLLAAFAADPLVKLTPTSNGPPRRRYQRFATFWSHAPPAEHA